MGAGLVCHDIGDNAPGGEFRNDIGAIRRECDGEWPALTPRLIQGAKRIIESPDGQIAVAGPQTLFDSDRIDLDSEKASPVHRGCQGLGASHPAETAGHNQPALERATEMVSACRGEGLVGPLHDALAADVDPGPGGHLPIHRESESLQPVKLIPRRPAADQVGIGNQDARRLWVGPKNADGLARLHEQRFVVGQTFERAHDRVKALPVPRGPAGAAIDNQLVRIFGHFRVEIIHQHPQGRFLMPALTGALVTARCFDDDGVLGHCESPQH